MYKLTSITAIGPLYIYGKFVTRFAENIVEQELFKETEHLVVYSEDGPELEVLRQYPNIRFIQEDQQLGVYNAWNIGIRNASTDYITNWNIDDIRYPTNTRIKYELLHNNPNYSVVYNYYVTTQDIEDTFYTIQPEGKVYLNFPDNYELYAKSACLCGPDPMWRKHIHDKIGYFDYENYKTIGDWEMWIRMAESGYRFKLIPEILCIYLDHQETVSNLSHRDRIVLDQNKRLIEKYKNFNTKQVNIEYVRL
jgi:GT2 family glycosyltransferase